MAIGLMATERARPVVIAESYALASAGLSKMDIVELGKSIERSA